MPHEAVQRPVDVPDRIFALDVLRGFAMFGVLVAYCVWSLGTAPEQSWSPFDHALAEVIGFAVDGKFYTMLAFLFGVGFSIQLGRASSDSAAIDLYCRRLAVLAAIGLTHALLLRNGDILLPYALTGFLLIPFRRASTGVVIAAAFIALAVAYGAQILWAASGMAMPGRPQLSDASYLVENAAWTAYWYSTAPFSWPLNLTLFLFGLLAGRHELVTRLEQRPPALVAIVGAGLAAGIVFYLARLGLVVAAPSSPIIDLLFTFHSWGIASAYAGLLLLAARSRTGATVLAPLAAVGRLALTNYLMQAALIVPVCLVFGLFDRFTPTAGLLLAFGMFGLVQLPFSLFWSRRFRFGPAEWLWRLLTYGRLPPLGLRGDGYARL